MYGAVSLGKPLPFKESNPDTPLLSLVSHLPYWLVYTIILSRWIYDNNLRKCHILNTSGLLIWAIKSETLYRPPYCFNSTRSHFNKRCVYLKKPLLILCDVFYRIVLYCGRVPAANAPGCTAAEGLLYKPWSLVVPTCTARCIHQRP